MSKGKTFNSKTEIVKELEHKYGDNKSSYYNTDTNKSRENFWTYNRTLQHYYSKERRVEQVLQNIPHRDNEYLISQVLECDGDVWMDKNDPELYKLIIKNYYWIVSDLGLEFIK